MDEGGYVACTPLIAYLRTKKGMRGMELTVATLEDVVRKCPKQRFEMKVQDGESFIRATQGHSIKTIKDDAALTRITDPSAYPVAVHGTYARFLPAIREEGLRCGARNHIHIAIGEPGDGRVVSGARSSCDTLIYIDLAGAMADGIPFYESTNRVILTRGVDDSGVLPPKYFARVVPLHRGK